MYSTKKPACSNSRLQGTFLFIHSKYTSYNISILYIHNDIDEPLKVSYLH